MTAATLDVVAVGNAIVDIIAAAEDHLIEAEGLTKGGMPKHPLHLVGNTALQPF